MLRNPKILFALVCLASMALNSCTWQITRGGSYTWHSPFDLPAADSVLTLDQPLETYENKYQDEDGVFLFYDSSVEIVGSALHWREVHLYKTRFLILKPDEEWLTTFSVSYDRDIHVIDSLFVHITNPDGTVRQYGIDSFKEEVDSDGDAVLRFAYPDIRKGSMIEEGYIQRSKYSARRSMDYYQSLSFGFPCEELTYQFICPNDWALEIKDIGPDIKPEHSIKRYAKGNKMRVLTAERRNVPSYKSEPFAPNRKDVSDYLEFRVSKADNMIRYWEPASSWNELIDDMNSGLSIISRKRYLRRTTHELLEDAGLTSARDTLRTIVDFVRNTVKPTEYGIRYNYETMIEDSSAHPFVFCHLAYQMLQYAGLNSEMVLAHSNRDGYFDKNYVDISQASMPALAVELDTGKIMIFATIEKLPIGMMPPQYEEEYGVFFTLDTPPVVENMGSSQGNTGGVEEHYTVDIDTEGILRITERKTFRGITSYLYRIWLDEREEDDSLKAALMDMLTYDETEASIDTYSIENREDYNKELVIQYEYTIDNLVTVTSDEILFQTDGLFSPSSLRQTRLESDEPRRHPIRISYAEEFKKEIILNYPKSWELTTDLHNLTYSNDIGTLYASYTPAPGTLTVNQSRQLNRGTWPREKYPELQKIQGDRSKLHIPTLIFEQ